MKKFECAVCGEDQATLQDRVNAVTYKGHSLAVPLRYFYCANCESEFSSVETTSYNNRQMVLAEKKADGMLTGDEIYKIRGKLNISQKVAAQLFGGGPKAFSKYEANEIKHNESMDTLLRFFNEKPESLKDLAKLKKVELKQRLKSVKNYEILLLEAYREKALIHKAVSAYWYRFNEVESDKLPKDAAVFYDKGTFSMRSDNKSDDFDFECI